MEEDDRKVLSSIRESENFNVNDIIDDDDEDEEYLYDLKKKQQGPRNWKLITKRFIIRNKNILYALLGFCLLLKLSDLLLYTTYPYYSGDYKDYDSNFVAITKESIQNNYHEALMNDVDWTGYAYVSYATNLNYLCASLMVFHKLRTHGSKAEMILFYDLNPNEKDHRFDYLDFEDHHVTLAKNLQVKLIRMRSIEVEDVQDLNFKRSFNKLVLFQFEQYGMKYRRMIYVDSDVYIQDNLDELFFLPDEFDLAMPMAYWLIESGKNYKNLLSSYPSQAPNFASSEKGLHYFRIPEDKNLKWTSALMVIKPSELLTKKINSALQQRTKDEYDMDIINNIFTKTTTLRRLTLPHKDYFMISGDYFLTPENRHKYLSDPIDLQFINSYSLKKCNYNNPPYWCLTDNEKHSYLKIAEKAKIIHFSDFPLPKPWVQSYLNVTCGGTNPIRNTIVVKSCDDYNAWGHFHNLFIRERIDVCQLHQDIEDDY